MKTHKVHSPTRNLLVACDHLKLRPRTEVALKGTLLEADLF